MNSILEITGERWNCSVRGDAEKEKLEISGVFIPENSDDLFGTLHEWIVKLPWLTRNRKIQVLLKVVYANNAIKNHLRRLISELDELVRLYNYSVNIYWFYEEEDDDSLEDGEELMNFYVKESHFRLIEVDKLRNHL